jgi:hypothetical protein
MRVKPFALLSLSICLTILSIVLIIKLHDQDLIYNLLVLNLSREMTDDVPQMGWLWKRNCLFM